MNCIPKEPTDLTGHDRFGIRVPNPEQMFNTDPLNLMQGISEVKALQLASQKGQRIYTITQANQAITLPNIHHDSATKIEIE